MKKLLLSLTLLLTGLAVQAQCTIATTPNSPGAYPSALDSGCVNSSYDETVTLVFPLDTVVFGTTYTLDSATITSISNVPTGLVTQSSCGSFPCTVYPNAPTPAKTCISLSGIPTSAFINDSIEVQFTVYVFAFGSVQAFPSSQKVALTIHTIDNSTTVSGSTITANETGATYQWLDCNNANAPIAGATSQSYTAITSGTYAVEITKNTCVDTSACETIATVGLTETNFAQSVKLYPNPTNNIVNVASSKAYKNITINVTDITGKTVLRKAYSNNQIITFNLNNTSGVYFVEVSTRNEKATFKVIKK